MTNFIIKNVLVHTMVLFALAHFIASMELNNDRSRWRESESAAVAQFKNK